MKILVLGVTGMLGSAVFHTLQSQGNFEVWGTLRDSAGLKFFDENCYSILIPNVDVLNQDALLAIFERIQPNLVINCVGLIKQLSGAKDPLVVLPINAMFPHRLARVCEEYGSRLIHISTDCVFSGKKGDYVEWDPSDADDLYGKSKFIGELTELPHAITLRTSIIGHELNSNFSLIDWFLSQKNAVKGYKNAIFSGLPTVELARVIMNFVLPKANLCGLYHVAAEPINKFDLLSLVAEIYGKKITIMPDEELVINRSLNSDRFTKATGYKAPKWPNLIKMMHESNVIPNTAIS